MQQRIKSVKVFDENGEEEANEMPDMPSSIPFLPHVVILKATQDYSLKKFTMLTQINLIHCYQHLGSTYNTHSGKHIYGGACIGYTLSLTQIFKKIIAIDNCIFCGWSPNECN